MKTNKMLVLGILLSLQPAGYALAQQNPAEQAVSPASPAVSPPNAQLNSLLEQRRFTEAYELAHSNLGEWEGDTEFDFLYGMAAIESGNANEAVYAFERVAATAATPTERGRARLELARAYYLTNNMRAAEALFNRVLATNPPQNVRENIQAFLVLIDANKRTEQSTLSWSVAGNAGYDDNINSATAEGLVDTPLIGQIELDPSGLKTGDEFSDLAAGMAYRRFITRDQTIDFNVNLNRRDNLSSDQFDLDSLRADLAYNHGNASNRFRYSVQATQVNLDGTSFQQSTGVSASWQHASANGWYQSLSASLNAIRYDNEHSPNNDLRDINQQLISAGLIKLSDAFTNSTSIYYADESALETRGEHNGRSYYGIAHNLSWRMNSAHTPYARVSLQKLTHDDRHPVFFRTTRSDATATGALGWTWQASRRLSVTGELSYTDSDSNIDLFTYSRSKAQAGFRYQF